MMYEKKRRHKIRVAFEAGFPTRSSKTADFQMELNVREP
jgi:hypothetical protein